MKLTIFESFLILIIGILIGAFAMFAIMSKPSPVTKPPTTTNNEFNHKVLTASDSLAVHIADSIGAK